MKTKRDFSKEFAPGNALVALEEEFREDETVFPFLVRSRNMSPTIREGAIVGIDTSYDGKGYIVAGEIYLIEMYPPRIPPHLWRVISLDMEHFGLRQDNPEFQKICKTQKIKRHELITRIVGRVKWSIQKFY